MKRRQLLQGAGAAVALGGVLSACGGQSEENAVSQAPAVGSGTRELTMVTSWPKNFPGLGTAAERFAQRIETASDGRFRIKVFAGGELVHPLKCLDAVQEGTADLYHSAEYYYTGKDPAFAYFSAVPFGLTASENNAWIMFAGGQPLWDELSAEFGVKPFICGNTGCQMGGWFKKEIRSVEDFKGLKMRIPGLGGNVLSALGGTPVSLGGAEIMPAFEAGTIDATEWVGPWNDLAFGFYKVARYYYFPGFHEPGTTLSCGMSRALWDSLSKADQALFTNCAVAEDNANFAQYNANNADALRTLIDEHGVQLRELSDDMYRAIGAASRDVLSDSANASPMSRRVYDSFMTFRRKALRWAEVSDPKYVAKRALVTL